MTTLSQSQFSTVPQAYAPIRKSDLSTPDGRRSRPVSHEEFQEIAARGERSYNKIAKPDPRNTRGLDERFDHIADKAHAAAQEPWGGVTLNPRTGRAMDSKADAYALTVRPPGHPGVSVPANAGREVFHAAMHQARAEYEPVLQRRGHHLGVFHDADKGTIDIDPVLVVHKREKAEEIGAYTRNTGGAYHFASGDGYWPPHVRD